MNEKKALEKILATLTDIPYDSLSSCEKMILGILRENGVEWHINCGDVKKGKKK